MKFYGGIEGGGTSTKVLILNDEGKKVAECEGEGSNVVDRGINRVVDMVNDLVCQAKTKGNISINSPLETLGLCLSGAESNEIKDDIKVLLMQKYPNCSKMVMVENDLIGSGLSCVGKNSIVHILISGTGSNSGTIANGKIISNTGGLGYLLGDRGSGYSLASRAIRIVAKRMTGFPCKYEKKYDCSLLEEALKKFFHCKDITQLINSIYLNFSPQKIAAFTLPIAKLAETGDPLSLELFSQVGRDLARYFNSNIMKIKNSYKIELNEAKILCIGSVWKSWNLLKNAFTEEMKQIENIKTYKLIKLKGNATVGCVILASPHDFSYKFDEEMEVFHSSN